MAEQDPGKLPFFERQRRAQAKKLSAKAHDTQLKKSAEADFNSDAYRERSLIGSLAVISIPFYCLICSGIAAYALNPEVHTFVNGLLGIK